MPWLDLDQQQQESPFTPMGWLGGAQPTPEDPSAAMARRMRQQSPNVPASPSWMKGAEWNSPAQIDSSGAADARDAAGARLMRNIRRGREMPNESPADPWQSGGATVPFSNMSLDGGVPPAIPQPVPPVGMPQPGMPQSDPSQMFGPGAPNMMQPPGPPSTIGGPVPLPRPRPPEIVQPGAQPSAEPSAMNAMASAPQPQPSLLDRIGNGINNNSELLLSLGAGFAGAPSFGAGMQRAFSNARPLMGRNQTVDALVKRGMPEEMARAAVSNPEVLKQVLPQFFGAKQRKFTQVGEDMMGNKQFGFVDEVSNKVYDLAGKEMGQSQPGADIPIGPDGQHLQGEELRAHIAKTNPVVAAALKDMFEGKQNPNARNLQKLAPLASLVYPGFDATDYPNRLKLRNSYTSGKDHQELEAINTVSGHMGKLMDSADKLGNTGFKPWNTLTNFIADKTVGSPALVRFRNDLVTTQNELAKAYHGGHVSDSAFNAFNKAINEAQTPDELKASIGELAGLLHSKIATKENSYRVGMQHAPLPQEYSAMSDEAKNAFSKIHDWSVGNKPLGGAPGAAPPSAPAAVAPAPGKYVYDLKTGTMVRQ